MTNNINLDRILEKEIGQWGKFQLKLLVLCGLVGMAAGLQAFSYLFTLSKTRTRCLIPECENASASEAFSPPWILDALPILGDSFENCHRFLVMNPTQNPSGCWPDNFDKNSTVPCKEYVYEHKHSAYFEFNLACDDFRPYVVGSARLFGTTIALPVKGFVSDRWGRRLALALTSFNLAWAGTMTYFAGSYNSYITLSFMENLLGACSITCAFILALEYVQPKHRVAALATLHTFHTLGEIILGLIAWTEPYWRHLILMLYVPQLTFVIYFWIAPESVRWLMSKGRYEESLGILRNAAEMNGNCLSENTLKIFSETKNNTTNEKVTPEPWLICLVFGHKPILLRCLLTPIWWFTCTLLYAGLTIFSVGISGNKYLNFIALVTMQVPGAWLAVLLMDRVGRKAVVMTGFWISGVCQIVFIFMSSRHYWLSLSVFLIGKMCVACVMTCIHVYTAELYPTRYRARFVAYSAMAGRVGSILAPFMPGIGARTWKHLPFVIFAVMALVSGLLVVLAPETRGATLPETMEEAAQLGKDSSVRQSSKTKTHKLKCLHLTKEQSSPQCVESATLLTDTSNN